MLEKNFIYIICGREIDERFNETWYGSSNPVSFKIIKKQKLEKLRYKLMCPTSDCEVELSFVVAGKSYLNQATKSAIYFMPV